MNIRESDTPPDEPEPRPPLFQDSWERDTWLRIAEREGLARADYILGELHSRSGGHISSELSALAESLTRHSLSWETVLDRVSRLAQDATAAGLCELETYLPTELADIVIRVADLCGAMGIDLQGAIAAKMTSNKAGPTGTEGRHCE